MTEPLHVAAPPDKPVMIFDGDCRFCRVWIERWQQSNGEAIEYVPFQDPAVAQRFPEIAHGRLERAVHLVEPNGRVVAGAEAVFRSLAVGARSRGLLWAYESVLAIALCILLLDDGSLGRVFPRCLVARTGECASLRREPLAKSICVAGLGAIVLLVSSCQLGLMFIKRRVVATRTARTLLSHAGSPRR